MPLHYNAFISYRHAEADSAVAADIQKRLERLRIPSEIRKKTGMKKIDRIFRDLEELPITSNLSDDISQALDNSDFLIVICSTRTKESQWVTREIEYFLKSHDHTRVLTALVDGEPYDVIPEVILKAGDAEFEPLSADYRKGFRKAHRTEIPRLAAPLIGCSYDELVMRERQYRMRRAVTAMAAVTALAVVGIGYLLWSRQRIAENYRQMQIQQSRYLASESGLLVESENRMTAVQLALEALPADGKSRPVVPEALSALVDASTTYILDPVAGRAIGTWSFRTNSNISDYFVTEDETLLVARDMDERVYVWNIPERKLLWSVVPGVGIVVSGDTELSEEDLLSISESVPEPPETSSEAEVIQEETGEEAASSADEAEEDVSFSRGDSIKDLFATEGGELVLVTYSRKIFVYSIEDGTLLWNNGDLEISAAVTCGKDNLAAVCSRYDTDRGSYEHKVLLLKSATGEIEYESRTRMSTQTTTRLKCSEDGFFFVYNAVNSSNADEYVFFDRGRGKFLVLNDKDFPEIDSTDFMFTEDGNILIKGVPVDETLNFSYEVSGITTVRQQHCVVTLLSRDGEKLWEQKFPFSGITMSLEGMMKELPNSSGGADYAIAVGRNVVLLRHDTGEILMQRTLPESPVKCSVPLGGTERHVRWDLMDGTAAMWMEESSDEYVQWNIFNVEVTDVSYLHPEGQTTNDYIAKVGNRELRYFTTGIADRSFDAFADTSTNYFTEHVLAGDNLFLFWNNQDSDDLKYYAAVYDLETRSLISETDLPERADFVGITEDQQYAVFTCAGEETRAAVLWLNLAAGGYSVKDLEEISILSAACVQGDSAYVFGRGSEPGRNICLKLTKESRETVFETQEYMVSSMLTPVISEDGTLAALVNADDSYNEKLHIIDLMEGSEILDRELFCDTSSVFAWNEDHSLGAVCVDQTIHVLDTAGDMSDLYVIDTGGKWARELRFEGDLLYAALDNGELYAYNVSDGSFAAKTSYTNTIYSNGSSKWVFTEDRIYFIMTSSMDVFDRESLTFLYSVNGCAGYDAPRGQYVCISGGERKIGTFHENSYEELLQIGRDFVRDTPLTSEQRIRYGLEE